MSSFGDMNRRQVLRAGGGLVAVAGTGGLAGCFGGDDAGPKPSGAGAGGGKPQRGGRLRVALVDGSPTDTRSPWNTPTYNGYARSTQVYERLFDFGFKGSPEPRLAESAEPNADGTVWQIKLRQGVTFHNGKPFTADDVLFSIGYIKDPKNSAGSAVAADPIDLRASKKVSDTEVELHLTRPVGDLSAMLSNQTFYMAPEGSGDFENKAVGTGPFTYAEFRPGREALFSRNPDYWQPGKPYVDEVAILTTTDPTARLNALRGGQVDEIMSLTFVQAKSEAGNKAIHIVRAPAALTNPFYVQVDAPIYRDNRVREALRLAVDREAMVKNVQLGFGQVGNDLFGLGYASYNDEIPQREHDPEKAASLLKAAGHYPLDLPLPSSSSLPGMLESATAYKEQAKAAGINVKLQVVDPAAHFSNNLYLKAPVYQTNFTVSFEEQAQSSLLKESPYNETHWFDSSWGAAFKKAGGIVDADKRNAAYKELQVPLWEKGGYILFSFYDSLDAAAPNVGGITPSIAPTYANLGNFSFKDHWIAR
jgi:peptide/nickel transport system substrate-binding protein